MNYESYLSMGGCIMSYNKLVMNKFNMIILKKKKTLLNDENN